MYLELSFLDVKSRNCLAPFHHLLGNAILVAVTQWPPDSALRQGNYDVHSCSGGGPGRDSGLSRTLLLAGSAVSGDLLRASVPGKEQGL